MLRLAQGQLVCAFDHAPTGRFHGPADDTMTMGTHAVAGILSDARLRYDPFVSEVLTGDLAWVDGVFNMS